VKKLLILIICCFHFQQASAQWIQFHNTEDYILFVRERPMVSSVGTVRGWFLWSRLPDKSLTPNSLIKFKEAECNKGQLRVLQITSYSGSMGGGNIVDFRTNPQEWSYPIPGTLSEKLYKLLCNFKDFK